MLRQLVMAWGVLGVAALLVQALVRLAPIAWEPVAQGDMTSLQWAMYIGWVVLNAHAEGYRGFYRRFSPRAVARAHHLGLHPRPLHVLAAPFFCMSLFHASRRGRIVAWSVSIGVVCLVMLVRALDQPWRGIVDGGVVVGLGLGLLSLLYFYGRVLAGAPPSTDTALP